MGMKILLLEDDEILAESLQEYLEAEGYRVTVAKRGEEVFDRTFEESFDLYILDINVPDVNGFEVLEALKEAEDATPAIYISAMTDVASMTHGFDLGAVDYIKKPFDPEELLLRIRHRLGSPTASTESEAFRFDPRSGRVDLPDGTHFFLGEIQAKILDLLLQRRGQVVPTGELMDQLDRPSPNALRVTIAKLKKRLGIAIENVRGQGYMIEKV
jgi:DNA-binding response OmpR family regulator